MALKPPNILTRQEFDQAMVHLRLNISEVSRETSIPRTYLSEFRNGDRQLRPENLAKLRDYFEGNGLEFEDEQIEAVQPSHSDVTETAAPQMDPEGIQRALFAIRHLAIDPNITNEQVEAILEKVAENDQKAVSFLGEDAESGLFSDWSEETDGKLRSVFGLFAENYVLLCHLQGRPLVMLSTSVEHDQIKTIADVVAHLFHEATASLIDTKQMQENSSIEEVTE